MSKVALYEQAESRESLKINKRIHDDLKKPSFFSALPIAVITFFLAAAVFAAAAQEWVIETYQNLGLIKFAICTIIVLILFVIAYCLYSRQIYFKKYERSRGTLWKYGFYRKKLDNLFKAETSGAEKGAVE